MHADEHALIDDLLRADALDRARDAEDELAADWARHTARLRHAARLRHTVRSGHEIPRRDAAPWTAVAEAR